MMYAAMDKIKAGATTRDLCEVWPDSPTYWGYEPDEWDKVSPHAVGHGIGLSLHEFPLFSRPGMGGDAVLEEGMVLALETWCCKIRCLLCNPLYGAIFDQDAIKI